MKKKYRIKKQVYIVLSIIIFFFVTILIFNSIKNKEYSIDYTVDNYDISENYDSTNNLYYFNIEYNNANYEFISNNKYIKNKKLINNINKYEDEEYICITIDSNYIDTYPLCTYKKDQIDYRLVSDNLKEVLSKYYNEQKNINEKLDNYNLYNEDNNILIWNYKGFNYIKGNKMETINIFSKDIYDNPLSIKINNYLVIPNYEQKYNFDEVYIINLNNKKIEKWKLKYEISFDSFISGINEYSIYIVDEKNKIEYELVPHRQKMRIVGTSSRKGIIYKEGKQEGISLTKLISNKEKFTYKNNYIYTLDNNKLYLSFLDNKGKTLVSNQTVDKIVDINNDNIFYICKDSLYKYNIFYGETKILTYSELEFNTTNMIIINN